MNAGFDRFLDQVVETRDTLDLLLDRRIVPFLIFDSIFIFRGVLAALLGDESTASGTWVFMVVVPLLVVGIPAVTTSISVERRSGTLDLVLASRSPFRYFGKRVFRILAFFLLQSLFFLLGMALEPGWPIALVHALILHVFAGAVVLFWTVRVRSAGAALAASFATLALFGKWIFTSAYKVFEDPFAPQFAIGWLRWPRTIFDALAPPLVLLLAALLFGLYARVRLRRLEALLD